MMQVDRARRLIRECSPLAADTVELLGAGTDSAAFRVDREWVARFPLVPNARRTLAIELALLPQLELPVAVPRPEHVAARFVAYRALEGEPLSDAALAALAPAGVPALDLEGGFTPVLLHGDIKPAHLLHDPSTGALTGLLDWGDVSLGPADYDLAIISMFCGPCTLQGLLDRMDDADAARASATIPFLLSVRRRQDALYDPFVSDGPGT
jgi:aminoglycoside phosphotransferase (APT) family kinase protein